MDHKDDVINHEAITPKPKKVGGYRPGSGRPKKMDELAIIGKLAPLEPLVFQKLKQKIEEGDINAIKIYLAYYLGQPTQRIESKLEGNLQSISVQIVRNEGGIG